VAQKFHFAILRIEVTRASRGLCATAEPLVSLCQLTSLTIHNSPLSFTPGSRPTSFTNLLAPGLTPQTLLLTVCSEHLGFCF